MNRIYILLISLALVACGKEKQEQTATEQIVDDNIILVTKTQFESEKMQLGTLSEQDFYETVKTTGFIDVPPQNKASVSTFSGGYVKRTPLLVGDKIKKGQLVATLENTEYVELQQQYLEVSEQLNYLKSEYTRQQTLFNEKITSLKNYLKAESTYKSALAHYNGLRQKLKMMHINPVSVEQGKISSTINLYAPIAGFVTKVNVSNGTFVSPSDEVIEIVNTDHIHLELSVFEKDILKIKKGQVIKFKIPESSDEVFEADVHLVGTSIDENNRTITVHGHIDDDSEKSFIMGMFIDADILTNIKKSKALPKESVAEIEGDYFALVLKNNEGEDYVLDKIKIDTGKQSEDFIEVLNVDNFSGKQVLTRGGFMLLSE